MINSKKRVDKTFLVLTLILISFGIIIFTSASLSALTTNIKSFYKMLLTQIVLGLGFGTLGMYLFSKIDYKFWREKSFYIFIFSLLLTASVFIPGFGFSHGGALRWINLGPITLQPVEILKFAFILYFAAWLSSVKDKVTNFKYGILPLFIILLVIGGILINQPDTKSFILISVTGLAMLFFSGVKLKHVGIIGLFVIISLIIMVSLKPYLKDRILTFLDPSSDAKGSSWQIQQSLIAVGSGGVMGRGYGQSIQKFTYLPEAHGDSIFAVLAEEFGFIGSISIIIFYLFWAFRGFKISNRSPDTFSRLLSFGIVILIISQSFLHIASVIGVFPLTGVPLVFMSQGGTSLMISLMAVGIILQISKYQIK